LTELFARLDANGVRMVLVERADRLARDLMVGEILLQQFRDRGVAVIEVEGGNDLTAATDDPTRKLIRQILGAVAEFDKSCLVAKLKGARDRLSKAKGRRIEGRAPFGWAIVDGQRVEVPAEQEAVKVMREMRDAKHSYREIASELMNRGVPAKSGGVRWEAMQVKNILDRERAKEVRSLRT
jgi:DNA invertase Pin-like site-specific DNA recombinase